MANLANSLALRRLVLPVLRFIGNFDMTIRHDLTGRSMRVHVFRHKGYWFYGSKRERDTLLFIQKVVATGDTVFDVGANIGYLTTLFAHLVGESGRVVAFEPGENNLPYLATNVAQYPNISVVRKAVSTTCGRAEFMLEDLSGQNNSLISDVTILVQNSNAAGVTPRTIKVQVETVSIDHLCATEKLVPSVIKIDVEGAELMVLKGMDNVLRQVTPIIIAEIWSWRPTAHDVLEYLFLHGYCIYGSNGLPVNGISSLKTDNVFCLHPNKHKDLIAAMF
jgi:FkbM family methyltransferase